MGSQIVILFSVTCFHFTSPACIYVSWKSCRVMRKIHVYEMWEYF